MADAFDLVTLKEPLRELLVELSYIVASLSYFIVSFILKVFKSEEYLFVQIIE